MTGSVRQSLADKLVAETLAHCGTGAIDRAALSRARRLAEPDAQARLLAYFQALPGAAEARRHIRRSARLFRTLTAVAAVIAFVAGAAAAGGALSAEGGDRVNILWALLSLLGVHAALFLIWGALMLMTPRAVADAGLGALLVGLWRGVWRRAGKSTPAAAAGRALGLRFGGLPAGRWVASTVTHGLWLAFLLGGLAMILIVLSTQRIVFVWETTILSASDYRTVIEALAAGVGALGFASPSSAEIAAAQWQGGPSGAATDAPWSSFLIGCVLVYGIAPRAAALALSLWRASRAVRRTPLDLSDPGLARLVPQLAPVVASVRVVSADDLPAERPAAPGLTPAHDPGPPKAGPVAVAGFENERPEEGWPPPGGPVDFGIIDGTADLKRVRDAVAERRPGRLVIVADLDTTPDRGVQAGLAQLRAAAQEGMVLLLTRWHAALDRLGQADARQRLEDWVATAHRAGLDLDAVVELDLDRLGPDEKERLKRIMGAAR